MFVDLYVHLHEDPLLITFLNLRSIAFPYPRKIRNVGIAIFLPKMVNWSMHFFEV